MEIPIPKAWELHPMLVHFPIAFLLGGGVLLMLTGCVGGSIVYHHGAGVDPKIVAPEIREGHSHRNPKNHDDSAHEHTEH